MAFEDIHFDAESHDMDHFEEMHCDLPLDPLTPLDQTYEMEDISDAYIEDIFCTTTHDALDSSTYEDISYDWHEPKLVVNKV